MLALALLLGDVLEDEAPLCIALVQFLAVRIDIDQLWVWASLDPDHLVEAGVGFVLSDDSPVALAAVDAVLGGRVVRVIAGAGCLNVADQAAQDFRRLLVGAVIRRRDLHRGAIHTDVVDDLVTVLRGHVDRQADALIDLSAVADILRPLPTVVAVAHRKAGILDGQHAV